MNKFHDAETKAALLQQLAGAASICWDYPEKAGMFHAQRAAEYCEEALERLEELS